MNVAYFPHFALPLEVFAIITQLLQTHIKVSNVLNKSSKY
jgi:hypothetical protein